VVRVLHLNKSPAPGWKKDDDEVIPARARLHRHGIDPPGAGGNPLPPPALPLQEGYKVLVLDKLARDVLTPLLRIKDLRSHGVTLHLPLDSPRQNIPDVPAVYLVQPTAESVDRVVQDAATGTYERFHLNFVTPLPRDLMERFADGVVRAGCVDRVASVHDQMLGFVALESGVFSLAQKDAYLALHDPKASDDTIGALINRIVDGLACVCATLGAVSPLPRPHGAPPPTPPPGLFRPGRPRRSAQVPIIKCPRGGASEHVALALDARLRDHIKAKSGVFPERQGVHRPLLVLLERNFDLAAPLAHPWSYKGLVQDVFGLRMNRVAVEGEGAAQQYEVGDDDFFWAEQGDLPFPKVAEQVDAQLKAYKAAVDEINVRAARGEDAFADPQGVTEESTRKLMAAVRSLPELTERKKVLDKHTNLATGLLKEIKGRGLDAFNGVAEEAIDGKVSGTSAGPCWATRIAFVGSAGHR